MKRDLHIDGYKFILICLVIIGHRSAGLVHNGIYAFHMPLFVYLSGMFSRRMDFSSFLNYNKNLIRTFLVAYSLLICYDWIRIPHFSWYNILVINHNMWYIFCLPLWRLMLSVIPERLVNNRVLCCSLSVMIALLVGFIPIGRELSFQRLFSFFPFFLLGYYYKDAIIVKGKPLFPALAVVLFAVALAVSLRYDLRFIERLPYGNWQDFMHRLIAGCWASLTAFAFVNMIPRSVTSRVAEYGKDTLFYYIYHIFFYILVGLVIARLGITENLLTNIVIWAAAIICLTYLRKVKFLKKIMFIK